MGLRLVDDGACEVSDPGDPVADDALRLLRDDPGGRYESAHVAAAIGVPEPAARAALTRLVRRGLVATHRKGVVALFTYIPQPDEATC